MRRLCVLLVLMLGAAACSGSSDAPIKGTPTTTSAGGTQATRTEPYRIVVTLPLFADFVREIGGDRVTVTTLIPPGADPHTYAPTSNQADVVANADIIFVNGGGLETPTLEFIEANKVVPRVKVIPFAGNVPSPSVEQPLDKPIYATDVGDNPHLYLNPLLGKVYPETVADSLYQLNHEEYFRARYQTYFAVLRDLDKEIEESLEKIPSENRVLVTDHDSFEHFTNRYGFTVLGTIADANNVLRPSLTALEEALRTDKPRSIFTEVGFETGTIQRLADQTGIEVCRLYSDIVDEQVTTYVELLRHNADELVRCLR